MKFVRARQMTCRAAVRQASEYLDQSLSRRERRRLEHHLADCPHCLVLVAQLRTTISLAGHTAIDDLSPEAERALTALLRRPHMRGE
jgi:anti-sigma factor RsiW